MSHEGFGHQGVTGKAAGATGNPHFETVSSWKTAQTLLTFAPRQPLDTAGHQLQSISIFVRDHKLRELPLAERSLEAHYGAFALCQVRKGVSEARRLALTVPYGRGPCDTQIAGCAARVYERGPPVPPHDIDGRSPAVVVWHDGEMFYLLASEQMSADALVRIANSLYP